MAGKLTAKEAFLFYCLALKSDYITNESNIEQETLAKDYGIEDTRCVFTTDYYSIFYR